MTPSSSSGDTDRRQTSACKGFNSAHFFTSALQGFNSARFSPEQTRQWFEGEGVELKVEADGRVFPVTDDAETIAGALRSAAHDAGVRTVLGANVVTCSARATCTGGVEFAVEYQDKRAGRSLATLHCGALLIATGSAPAGYKLARGLGHSLVRSRHTLQPLVQGVQSVQVCAVQLTPSAAVHAVVRTVHRWRRSRHCSPFVCPVAVGGTHLVGLRWRGWRGWCCHRLHSLSSCHRNAHRCRPGWPPR